MVRFLLRAAVSAFGLWLASRIVPGIRINGAGALVGAALVLGVLNAIVRPILVILTLPITIVTLGLFLLVVNAATFGMVGWLLKGHGFEVQGFAAAFFGALIVSAIGWVGSWFIHKD